MCQEVMKNMGFDGANMFELVVVRSNFLDHMIEEEEREFS